MTMLVAAASSASGQSCLDERPFSPIYGGGGVGGEGETPLACTTTIIPKGRRFISLIYLVTYEDITDNPRPQGRFALTLRVTAGASTLLTEFDSTIMAPEYFAADSGKPFTSPLGKPGVRYRKRVERIVDVKALAAAGDTPVAVWYAARNQTEPPDGCVPTNTCASPDSVNFDARLYSDIRFVLSESITHFMPRDSRDKDEVSRCSTSRNMCWPEYTALIAYKPGELEPSEDWEKLRGRIRFNLNRITRLRGNSSNGSRGKRDEDYEIESERNPALEAPVKTAGGTFTNVRVRTLNGLASSATLTVSSLDYGGRAELAAAFLPGDGSQIEAEIVRFDGSTKENATFVSLPIDDDRDLIADEFERSFGSASALSRDEDAEPGHAANSPKGDGFTALDEYRGFHFIERQGNQQTVRWERTDPRRFQDVFFNDGRGRFHAALRLTLDQQGSSNRKHQYRELAGSHLQRSKGKWVRVNRYSEQTRREGFPVVFRDATLDKGFLGHAGDATNNGVSAIRIDRSKVHAAADTLKMDRSVLLAQVVAHEAGHKFGRRHPLRPGCCTETVLATPPAALGVVSTSEVAWAGSKANPLYVRLATYMDPGDNNVERRADGIELSPYAPRVRESGTPKKLFADSAMGVHLYEVNLTNPLPANATNVGVQIQRQFMMDWTPRSTIRTAAGWTFAPDDLNELCVHPRCRRP